MLNLQLWDFSLCAPWKVAALLYAEREGPHFFRYPHDLTVFFLNLCLTYQVFLQANQF